MKRLPSMLLLVASLLATFGRPALGQQRFQLQDSHWQEQEPLAPATPEGMLQNIRQTLQREEAGTAVELADQWIQRYPNHPLLAEAYLLRGDAYVAGRKYYKSLFDYEYVIRVFPDSPQFNSALEREYEIARLFGAGLKRRWLGLRIMSAAEEAEELFIRIQERSPGSEVAEMASLALGDFYFKRSEMTSATEAYQLFLGNYPKSRYRQHALLRLIQAYLAAFKGPMFDSTSLIEAEQWLKALEQEFPISAQRLGSEALLLRIAESQALKMYHTARWYDKLGQTVSAVYTYQRVVRDHSQTVAAKAAMKRLAELGQPAVPTKRINGSGAHDAWPEDSGDSGGSGGTGGTGVARAAVEAQD